MQTDANESFAGQPIADSFDFEAHRQQSCRAYEQIRPSYVSLCDMLKDIITKCLDDQEVRYHSIEARAKSIKSFSEKVLLPSEVNPDKPKYSIPIEQITDLAGIRIITFFPKTIDNIDKLIYQEFEIVERSDKSELLEQEAKLGYQSIHYLVKLRPNREHLPEYRRYSGLKAEIQLRTILQHAWAEIEHDIQYKSEVAIPVAIKRRFMTLAGLLEIADREFQAIQDEHILLLQLAKDAINKGQLENVELTPDALKIYLDKKLGSDGRISVYNYPYAARYLIRMGFSNVKQIEECIKDYNPQKISKILGNTRQGQLSRFYDLLLIGMGANFIKRRPWNQEVTVWERKNVESKLTKAKSANVKIGNYEPMA